MAKTITTGSKKNIDVMDVDVSISVSEPKIKITPDLVGIERFSTNTSVQNFYKDHYDGGVFHMFPAKIRNDIAVISSKIHKLVDVKCASMLLHNSGNGNRKIRQYIPVDKFDALEREIRGYQSQMNDVVDSVSFATNYTEFLNSVINSVEGMNGKPVEKKVKDAIEAEVATKAASVKIDVEAICVQLSEDIAKKAFAADALSVALRACRSIEKCDGSSRLSKRAYDIVVNAIYEISDKNILNLPDILRIRIALEQILVNSEEMEECMGFVRVIFGNIKTIAQMLEISSYIV